MSDAEESGFLARWARRKALARSGAAPADAGAPQLAGSEAAGVVAPGAARVVASEAAQVVAPEAAQVVAPEAAQAAPSEAAQGPHGSATALVQPRPERPSSSPPPPSSSPLPASPAPAVAAPAVPTLDDVARLTRSSDYSRFVQPGVATDVRNAALKQLFTDPHFNVMDGLDTYIDDYGKPDPIPLAMLRRMNQSKLLGLFDDDEKDAAAARASPDGAAPRAVAESAPTDVCAPPPDAVPTPTDASPTPTDDDADLRLQQDDGAGCAGPAPGTRA